MYDFASTVDKFVSSYQQPEKYTFARDMCDKIVSFLTASLSVGITSCYEYGCDLSLRSLFASGYIGISEAG